MNNKNDKKGITKRNDIQKIIGYKTLSDKWKQKVLEQQMITGKIEHHLIINPHIVGYDEYKLLEVFRMILIKFYRQKIGKSFNKKKNKQMSMLFAPEYTALYDIDREEKHTHLHCIIQTDDENMLNEFHNWMKERLDKYLKREVDYQYKVIDTPEYRINCYNYIRKEGRQMFSNTDFYYKKSDKNKPF